MLFCDKHFETEFLKIERWGKFIGIPFFTIMAILFLSEYPFVFHGHHFVYHVVFSFVAVIGIWFSVRFMGNFLRKFFKRLGSIERLIVQLVATTIFTVGFTIVLHKIGFLIMPDIHDLCPDEFADLKNIIITDILLTFLINTIYEGFYLFLKLSETALETERYKKESIEAQYQNLTSRLNPHFLFNSLNTLTTVVEEDPKKAVNYIRELSQVYRYVLNSHKSTWIDLPSELKFTESYILLMKMRFEDNLQITMDICEKHINYYILPLTVQLLIENAVKHNEISETNPLTIHIFCNDELLVVSNNKQKRNIMPSTTKVGLHNITERYRFLVNKEVVVEDLDETFTVKIPLVKLGIKEIDNEKSIFSQQ
jgi:sensor histidine kinase YesM